LCWLQPSLFPPPKKEEGGIAPPLEDNMPLRDTTKKKHPSKKKPQVQCRHKCLLKEQKAKLRKTPGSKSHGKLSAQGALPLDVAHIVNDLQKREQPDKKKKPDKNNLTKKSAALHFT